MAFSFLDVKDGIYDPLKRFAFTNINEPGINEEPFTFTWNSQPITVKLGATVELPHHLAIHATKNLVNKIMQGIARDDEVKTRAKNKDPYWRSPKGISVGVPSARKIWEDKILRELKLDEESPEVAVLKAEIKEQLLNDIKQENAKPISRMSVGKEEFAVIDKKK